MSAEQYPAIIRSALACGARREHLEEAVLASLHHTIRSNERGGEKEARAAIGEEGWAWILTHYRGLGPIIAARVDLVACHIVGRLAAHLAHAWANPPAALMGTTPEVGEDDVVGDREVALLFIELWVKNGLEAPLAEVRGLWIRRGDARSILTEVFRSAKDDGFLDAPDQTHEQRGAGRMMVTRIVLNRLQHGQVQRGPKRWVSPLAQYYHRQEAPMMSRAADVDSPHWQRRRGNRE